MASSNPHTHVPSTERSAQLQGFRCLVSPNACLPCRRRTRFRHLGGGNSGGASDSVLAVLRDPPKKIPRSPTLVMATFSERSSLEPEEEAPSVEVRWRVPSQASLAPTVCGDVERFYVKVWCRGKGKEVIRTKTSTVNVPRRDFCRNQVKYRSANDRGQSLGEHAACLVFATRTYLPDKCPF